MVVHSDDLQIKILINSIIWTFVRLIMQHKLAMANARDNPNQDGDLSVMLEYTPVGDVHLARLRKVCVDIEKARCEKDFIWKMVMADPSSWHAHWYSIMAQSMLRLLRCPPSGVRANSNFPELCRELFGFDRVGDISFVEEYDYKDLARYTQVWMSVNIAVTLLLTFIRDDYRGAMKGSNKAAREARKSIARTAFFFVALHYDLSFLRYVLEKNADVTFFEPVSILGYIRTTPYTTISRFVNGGISCPCLFVAKCMSSYVQVVNIDPYGDAPHDERPTEDPSVLHPNDRRTRRSPTPSGTQFGGMHRGAMDPSRDYLIGYSPDGVKK